MKLVLKICEFLHVELKKKVERISWIKADRVFAGGVKLEIVLSAVYVNEFGYYVEYYQLITDEWKLENGLNCTCFCS